MGNTRVLGLVDSDGKPFASRIERVLAGLLPKLQRQFPPLQDDIAATEVMEEAGRRISTREQRSGPIEKLHGYAWVTIRSVATSYLRRGSSRLVRKTLESEAGHAQIAELPADHASAEQIERSILLREILNRLSPEERLICLWKKAGFSSQEIAAFQGRSVQAVDTIFSRAKQKVRDDLGLGPRRG
jgi:RNA polymerase sigma factor (sigma-70 family)